MPRQIHLSVEDSRTLREIVDHAGLGQQELSDLAGVSTGWLSGLLKERGQRPKAVEADLARRLAATLVDRITNLPAEHKLPQNLSETFLRFLARYAEVPARLLPPKIYTAGGPIPVDAAHYIERPSADPQLLSGLQAEAFSMIVRGPVQCGKSSLLVQLENKARAKGIETAWFDPRAAVGSALDTARRPADIIAATATKLAKTLQVEWRLDLPSGRPIEYIEDVSGWLLSALDSANRKRRLLIMDDLGTLGVRAAEEWLSFVRLVDTKRASRNVGISIAVGMTHYFGPSFRRKLEEFSSIVSWSPRIELEWLSKKQSAALEEILTKDTDLNLYELFRGQPYLTHEAATDEKFRDAVQQWTSTATERTQRAVRETLPYQRHLKAIRSAILGPPWQDRSHAQRLIDSFEVAS